MSTFSAGLYDLKFREDQSRISVDDFLQLTRRWLPQRQSLQGLLEHRRLHDRWDDHSGIFFWRCVARLRSAPALDFLCSVAFSDKPWSDLERQYAAQGIAWMGTKEAYRDLMQLWQVALKDLESPGCRRFVQGIITATAMEATVDVVAAGVFLSKLKLATLDERLREAIEAAKLTLEERAAVAQPASPTGKESLKQESLKIERIPATRDSIESTRRRGETTPPAPRN